MVNKRKKRKLINQMKDLLYREAQKQASCLKALCKEAESEEPLFYYLEHFDAEFYQPARCMEVGWNKIKDRFTDLDDMITHNVFYEAQRVKTPQWKKIGRDSGVRAIHHFIREIVQNDDLWEELEPINFFGDSWGEMGERCPVCGRRYYTREREGHGYHADGTENWRWEYTFDWGQHGDHCVGYSSNYSDFGLFENIPFDLLNLLNIDLHDFLDEQEDVHYLYEEKGSDSCKLYFHEDYEEIYDRLFELVLKKFKKWYFGARKSWILEKIGYFKKFTTIEKIDKFLTEKEVLW